MTESTYLIDGKNIICGICLEEWLDRDPRILQCQHTFCFECLKDLSVMNSTMTCPICCKSFYLRNSNADNLPKNIFNSYIQKQYKKEEVFSYFRILVTLIELFFCFFQVLLCNEHKKSGILHCLNHNLSNLCTKCFDENHKNCKFRSMEEQKEIEKKIDLYMNNEKKSEIKLKEILLKKKHEMLKRVEEEIQLLDDKISLYFKKREHLIIENIENDISLETEEINFQKNFPHKLDFSYSETVIKTGLDFNNEEKKEEIEKCKISSDDILENTSYIFRFRECSIEASAEITKDAQSISLERLSSLTLNNLTQGSFMKITAVVVAILSRETIALLKKSGKTLKKLQFNPQNFSEHDIKYVSDILSYCCNLEFIKFVHSTKIGDTSHPIFENLGQSAKSLRTILIGGWDLDGINAKKFSNLLSHCHNLICVRLRLDRYTLNIKTLDNLQKSIESLHLIFDSFNLDNNFETVSYFLQNCQKLKYLHFQNLYYFDGRKYPIFSSICNVAATLVSINIERSLLDESNLEDLAYFINQCSLLKSIYFKSKRSIGQLKHTIFKSLYKSSSILEILDLSFCDLNEENIENISNLFSNCSKLKSVDLSWNKNIGSTDHSIFKNLCTSSTTLENLLLSNCNLREETIKDISYLFSQCSNLKLIDFRLNENIGSTKYPIFQSLNKSLSTLQVVRLSYCKYTIKDQRNLVLNFPHIVDFN